VSEVFVVFKESTPILIVVFVGHLQKEIAELQHIVDLENDKMEKNVQKTINNVCADIASVCNTSQWAVQILNDSIRAVLFTLWRRSVFNIEEDEPYIRIWRYH
jgi:hypothetical protein